jgi:hypothetical protein
VYHIGTAPALGSPADSGDHPLELRRCDARRADAEFLGRGDPADCSCVRQKGSGSTLSVAASTSRSSSRTKGTPRKRACARRNSSSPTAPLSRIRSVIGCSPASERSSASCPRESKPASTKKSPKACVGIALSIRCLRLLFYFDGNEIHNSGG